MNELPRVLQLDFGAEALTVAWMAYRKQSFAPSGIFLKLTWLLPLLEIRVRKHAPSSFKIDEYWRCEV